MKKLLINKELFSVFLLIFEFNALVSSGIEKILNKTCKYYGKFDSNTYFSISIEPTPYEKLEHDSKYILSTLFNKGLWHVNEEKETHHITKQDFLHDDSSILGEKIVTKKLSFDDCTNRNNPNLMFLAFNKNQLIGQTRVNIGYDHSYVNNLRVHYDYRSQRIASHLMYFLYSELFNNLKIKKFNSHDAAKAIDGTKINVYEQHGRVYTGRQFRENPEMVFDSDAYYNVYLNNYLKKKIQRHTKD
jgi:ribosomal protein S18 acetylase RimI-like enzyme